MAVLPAQAARHSAQPDTQPQLPVNSIATHTSWPSNRQRSPSPGRIARSLGGWNVSTCSSLLACSHIAWP
jgi:hypothetical protein